MNIRYTALLCGFVMIAAVPVMADRMSDYGYSNDPAYAGIHAGLNNSADIQDAKHSLGLVTAFTSSSDGGAHSVTLNDFGSLGRSYAASDSGRAWGRETDRNGDHDRNHKKSAAPVAVPEPGSLSLLLIGLAGIGVIAFKRGAKQKVVSTVGGF